MAKKYRHLNLPSQFIQTPTTRIDNRSRRIIEDLPELTKEQNSLRLDRVKRGVQAVSEFEGHSTKRLRHDQEFFDLKLNFRGLANKAMLDKYRIKTYEHYQQPDDQEVSSDTVLGRIRSSKLKGQKMSDFDMLKRDIEEYVQTTKLKSYFDKVNDVRPLSTEELLTDNLTSLLREKPEEPKYTDVIFGDGKQQVEEKLSDLKDFIGENKFIRSINTDTVHYCRILATKQDLDSITTGYSGIISIDTAPEIEFSRGDFRESNSIVVEQDFSIKTNPVFVIDTPIDTTHSLLMNAVNQLGDTTINSDNPHGTAVASLVIFGHALPSSGTAKQRNRVIGVNSHDVHGQLNESLIEDTLRNHYSEDAALIANLSINVSNLVKPYDRRIVHRLTALMDEWSYKYNCVLTISIGNLNKGYARHAISDDDWKEFYKNTYPDFFDSNLAYLLPPGDSINNLCVGSLTYQASATSIAPLTHPSPITRKGLGKYQQGFVKPDIIHYDSNLKMGYDGLPASEDNGPYMATLQSQICRSAGTSYSTPIVAYELGILAQHYPSYRANTLKALLLHFTDDINLSHITNADLKQQLIGHGATNLERAIHSTNTSSTLVIEDEIGLDKVKDVKIPIPASIQGSRTKRLRIKKTLVYSPLVNPKNSAQYCPINLNCRLVREDGAELDSATTRHTLDGAHAKSNVKRYPPVERSTTDHMGKFWIARVSSEAIGDYLTPEYMQKFALIITIEDIEQDDSIDLHQEISAMIEIEVPIEIEVTA